MATAKRTSRFPKAIHNMILNGYLRNEHSNDCATRINRSATAKKLNVNLSTRQVAAVYAWITMKG